MNHSPVPNKFEYFFAILIIAFLLYFWLASVIFAIRNPTANGMTSFREFGSVLMFEKLDKYQGNK